MIQLNRFNQYDHNNYLDASPEFKSQVLEGEATLGQEQIYVQALGGVVTKITFPFIKNMASLGNLAINSAELIFTGVEENTGNAAPDRLTLVEINPDGTESDPYHRHLRGRRLLWGGSTIQLIINTNFKSPVIYNN